MAVYLGIDDMASIIRHASHKYHQILYTNSINDEDYEHVSIRGLADSGFFLDYQRKDKDIQILDKSIIKDSWYYPTPKLWEYHDATRELFNLMNMRDGLPRECLIYMSKTEQSDYLCLFPEYTTAFMLTPTFSKQVLIHFILLLL